MLLIILITNILLPIVFCNDKDINSADNISQTDGVLDKGTDWVKQKENQLEVKFPDLETKLKNDYQNLEAKLEGEHHTLETKLENKYEAAKKELEEDVHKAKKVYGTFKWIWDHKYTLAGGAVGAGLATYGGIKTAQYFINKRRHSSNEHQPNSGQINAYIEPNFAMSKAIVQLSGTDLLVHDPTFIRLSHGPKRTPEFWAPDISFHGGTYYLYYSVSKFGTNQSVIAFAISANGVPGSWRDHGPIIFSGSKDSPYNAIDPNLFVDTDGRWWLTFGSFFTGIQQVELDPATGGRKRNAQIRQIATRPNRRSNAIEAPFLFRRGDFYYLFVSFDFCCKGLNSSYHIMVGRSRSVNGPFLDKGNVSMLAGGGSLVLGSNGYEVGPGGQSVYGDGNADLLVYHFYDKRNRGAATLGIRTIAWDQSGWPIV